MTTTRVGEFRSTATNKISVSVTLTSALVIVLVLTPFAVPAAQAQTYSVIHSFTGSGGDGANPQAGVTLRNSILYGTTYSGGIGGANGPGTVYQMTHVGDNWTYAPIFLFPADGSGGAKPIARVVFGPDGHPYGTTTAGGSHNAGVVFDLIVPFSLCKTVSCLWKENVLYNFLGAPGDGANPGYGELSWDPSGNIYGTTGGGGARNLGTIYELTESGSNWTEKLVASFDSANYGGFFPQGTVTYVAGALPALLTTTLQGGLSHGGTVCKVSPPQPPEFPVSFVDHGLNGAYPYAGLTMDSGGNLYGATTSGGVNGGGTVFELMPYYGSYIFASLYDFSENSVGPRATLTVDGAGNLYGTTYSDGANYFGSVFKLTNTPSGWVYTSLHDFTGGSDGAYPISNVSIDTDGTLYGTTTQGGANNLGVVWMVKP